MENYGFVAIKVRDAIGSKLYRFKNIEERKWVPNSLGVLAKPKVEVVTLTNPDAYGEYGPYTELLSLEDLFRYVLNLQPDAKIH